jgi:hypothetical protein
MAFRHQVKGCLMRVAAGIENVMPHSVEILDGQISLAKLKWCVNLGFQFKPVVARCPLDV